MDGINYLLSLDETRKKVYNAEITCEVNKNRSISKDINIGDSTNPVTRGKLTLASGYRALVITITMDRPKDFENRFIKFEVRAKSQPDSHEYIFEKDYFKFQNAINEWKQGFAHFDSSYSSLLKIEAKFTVIEEIPSHIYETPEELQVKNEAQTFPHFAEFYFLNDELSDFSFTVGETKFSVHKMILSYRSPVFKRMFAGNFKERTSSSQVISDVSAEVFDEMLHFMYKSKISNLEHAEDLLAVADRYQIDDLKAIIENHLFHKLEDDNAHRFFQLAHRHNCCNEFKKECFEVLERLFNDINHILPEEFLNQPEKVREILDAKANFENLLKRPSTGEHSVGDVLVTAPLKKKSRASKSKNQKKKETFSIHSN
ncbi:CLUMA_CG010335, isoform A [Clunio marinus]|uniref:CLUMA_CG010335, isoform A n=1 Tax=Clunio marinus TaxID=568069 RepID=A0A1J1I9S2_9DIPT|nr:CLUMA_CG010335, isoform A [Clunio marinus]